VHTTLSGTLVQDLVEQFKVNSASWVNICCYQQTHWCFTKFHLTKESVPA